MFNWMCVLRILSSIIFRDVAPCVRIVVRVKFRVCDVGTLVVVVIIDALMGLIVCVSCFCVIYRFLGACEGCVVLSETLSILKRVADVLKGRADYGDAFVSV